MEIQINIAITILSALLTGGFILFFVENQHIERDIINKFRSIMDPFYHKLSNYLKFVYFINALIRYKTDNQDITDKFKSNVDKLSSKGGEVFAYSNNISYLSQKKLDILNDSINNVWYLFNEAQIKENIFLDTKSYSVFNNEDIEKALSEISPLYTNRNIDINLLPYISGEFYSKVWQPLDYVTGNFEYWEKQCRLNKLLLILSLGLVMIVMISAMCFPSVGCSLFITIPTIICCILFMIVLHYCPVKI
ncbi:MAG: hypothetical protein PHG06_07155 [Parabacteroides sp.]|nr:hypothetical protein [Parabacteroides sp.]